jgi:hypothetical protein
VVTCHLKLMMAQLLGVAALLSAAPASADTMAVVGILQGTAVLVRQTARFTLAEGAALVEGDIVETPADAYLQIEFGDGAIVGLGGSSRVILRPTLTGVKAAAAPRLYLLEGWVKASPPAKPAAELVLLSPRVALNVEGGAAVVAVDSKGYAVFSERGGTHVVPRDGAGAAITLKAGEFASVAGADKPSVAPRMSGPFLQGLPKMFRDTVPPRAALYAQRNPPPTLLGPVEYGDVKAWMRSEPGVRLTLSRQWRSRASDRAFRADLAANLSAHMEWERVLFPERFLPKKPPPPPPPRPVVPAVAASAASSP